MKIRKIDLEYGLIGGISMAVPIFVINLIGGVHRALLAALVQFGYTTVFSIIGNMLCRSLIKKSMLASVLAPSIATGLCTYLVHLIAHSPAPIYSASFSLLIALPCYTANSIRYFKSDKTLLSLLFDRIKKSKT